MTDGARCVSEHFRSQYQCSRMMSRPRRLEFGMFLVLMAGAVNKLREVSAEACARLHPDYCLPSA
jgi:hypothetical protein